MIKKAKCGTQKVGPNPKRFAKLIKLAKELAAELAPYTPPEGQGTPVLVIGLPEALAKGSCGKPRGALEAGEQDGAAIASGTSKVGGSMGGMGGSYQYEESAFRLLHPPVDRITRRIATDGDGMDLSDGLSNGPRLGQAFRLMTDGNCLARWNDNEHADGLVASILLDCSGSMDSILSECAGIALAFSQGMRECGAVQTLAFGTTCKETKDFDTVNTMGGTHTDVAVATATEWLKSKSGTKWLVCITDGQPDSQRRLDERCQEAHQLGIRILAVGINCKIEMPHAVCVTAKDIPHLAIELDAAARKIECG